MTASPVLAEVLPGIKTHIVSTAKIVARKSPSTIAVHRRRLKVVGKPLFFILLVFFKIEFV
jgi:hypothetical protein